MYLIVGALTKQQQKILKTVIAGLCGGLLGLVAVRILLGRKRFRFQIRIEQGSELDGMCVSDLQLNKSCRLDGIERTGSPVPYDRNTRILEGDLLTFRTSDPFLKTLTGWASSGKI